MNFTHLAFSDDSKHKDGRYNSLALVTLKDVNFSSIHNKLKEIFKNSGISDEFKWEKLRNAKYRLAAQKLIDFTFQNEQKMRVDILIWNLDDSRHRNILGRDDSENLVRMYYHLISTTCSKRWPIRDSCWKWYPDIQSSINWNNMNNCIRNKKHTCVQDLFYSNPEFENVNLEEIEPAKSQKHSLIQIADLFAGMGAYSWGSFETYLKWKDIINNQPSLFPNSTNTRLSPSEKERFIVISDFNKKCKNRSMQIAFESTRGFKSYVPKNFINFWMYEPQHDKDKAPTKQ